MIYCAKSSIGMIRQNNQDAFHIPHGDDGINLFIVADGMGGTNGGEIASSLAICSICSYFKDKFNKDGDIPSMMRSAIEAANRAIYRTGRVREEYNRMGTTVTMALIIDSLVYVAHVGDSRAYILNKNKMRQITVDHSYVQELVNAGEITLQEAKSHPDRHKITRAVGINGFVSVDVFIEPIQSGDCLLICSDGLTTMLDDEIIFNTIINEQVFHNAASSLVSKAEQAGGYDNITVVLVNKD